MNLKKLGKAVVKSLSGGDVTQHTQQDEQAIPSSHIQAEEQYMTRVNDLKKEFVAEEQVISSSNLSIHQKPKWVVQEEYKGFMILTNDLDSVADWKDLIDNGHTQGLMTVQYWNKYYDKKIVDTPDDQQYSADDVAFEQDRMKDSGYFPKDTTKEETTFVIPGKLPKDKDEKWHIE